MAGLGTPEQTVYDNFDGENCFYGGVVKSELYFTVQDDGVTQPFIDPIVYWNSEAEIQAAVGPIAFNTTEGAKRATRAFLTTNCPALKPVAVWNSTAYHPGTAFPGNFGPGVTRLTPLACACADNPAQNWYLPVIVPPPP